MSSPGFLAFYLTVGRLDLDLGLAGYKVLGLDLGTYAFVNIIRRQYIHRVRKKVPLYVASIILPNADRLSKFFVSPTDLAGNF